MYICINVCIYNFIRFYFGVTLYKIDEKTFSKNIGRKL